MDNFLMQRPICEGKTKAIFSTFRQGVVEIYNKDDVTALDGDKKDMFPEKGDLSNEITCNIFNLLAGYGIGSHFIKKVSNTSFFAVECERLPIEVVVRRVASGSYLKRNPNENEGVNFAHPVVEFFLKDDQRHDPYIDFRNDLMWYLYDPKKPIGPDSFLCEIASYFSREEIEEVVRQANNIFVILEWYFGAKEYKLFNFKIEFGRVKEGRYKGSIIWNDVLTPDEWILKKDGIHYDKQPFRDGAPASYLKEPYKIIARETADFKLVK